MLPDKGTPVIEIIRVLVALPKVSGIVLFHRVCDFFVMSHVGLPITKGNVQTVLRKSRVSEGKSWLSTLRCFSLPAGDVEKSLSPSQKTQYLSESWLETVAEQKKLKQFGT